MLLTVNGGEFAVRGLFLLFVLCCDSGEDGNIMPLTDNQDEFAV